jgi:hypothetical protein
VLRDRLEWRSPLTLLHARFSRVAFLHVNEGDDQDAIDEDLEVPALKCDPSNAESPVTPGESAVAEVRVGDKILLAGVNTNRTKGQGSGIAVDSMVLLQNRAEKQFFARELHKENAEKMKKEEAMRWVQVSQVDPMRGMVCVSTQEVYITEKGKGRSDAAKKGATTDVLKGGPLKWLKLGALWNAWVYRDESEEGEKAKGVLYR